MRTPRKPDPEVLETDYRVPTGIGTAAWAVALVVLLAMGDRIGPDDRWWLWVCGTGIVLGVFAYFYIPRLLRKRAEADVRAEVRHAAKRAARREGAADRGPAAPAEAGSTPDDTVDTGPELR